MIKKILIYILILIFSFSVKAEEQKVEFQYDGLYLRHINLDQLKTIYDDYDYHDFMYMPNWKFPPIFLETLPTDFSSITDPQLRNRLFLQIVTPLALKLNEEIIAERDGIEALRKEFEEKHDLSPDQIKYLEEKAEKYDIFTRLKGERRYALYFAELNEKVDIIPPSIMIASAAIETNWGTNRPAQIANSLYRELVWYTDEGLEPLDEKEDKSYRYKIFPTLYDSMKSHALKINSHVNYEMFRYNRHSMKERGTSLQGRDMAHNMIYDSNLQNFAGILDYTITFYMLGGVDEAQLAPLELPKSMR